MVHPLLERNKENLLLASSAPSAAASCAEFPVRKSEELAVEEVPKLEVEAMVKACWIARTVE
jgi:hypothetical protein